MSEEFIWTCPDCGADNVLPGDAVGKPAFCRSCGRGVSVQRLQHRLTKRRAGGGSASPTKKPRRRGITPLARKPRAKKPPEPDPRPKNPPSPSPTPPAPPTPSSTPQPRAKKPPESNPRPKNPPPSPPSPPEPPPAPPTESEPSRAFRWTCPDCGATHVINDPMRFDKCPACGYVIAPADWLACREPDASTPNPPPPATPEKATDDLPAQSPAASEEIADVLPSAVPATPEEPAAIVSATPTADPGKPEDKSEGQSNNGCDRGTVIGCLSLLFLLWLAWEAVSFLYNWIFG